MNFFFIIMIIILIGLGIYMYKYNIEEFNITKFSVGEKLPKYLDDKLFQDVILYDNDEDGRLGLDKCYEELIKNEGGYCVEFGQTGNASYFPKNKPLGKNNNTIYPFNNLNKNIIYPFKV